MDSVKTNPLTLRLDAFEEISERLTRQKSEINNTIHLQHLDIKNRTCILWLQITHMHTHHSSVTYSINIKEEI